MKNKIIELKSYKELNLKKYSENKFFIVRFDGKVVNDLGRYFNYMKAAFNLPDDADKGWDQFDDWITDLDWIDHDKGICVVIYNYKSIDDRALPEIIEDFEETILPFWEHEAPKVIQDGKIRKFDVYLIEDIDSDGRI